MQNQNNQYDLPLILSPQKFYGKCYTEHGAELFCHENDGIIRMLVDPNTENCPLFRGVNA
jgi:hypothetical protein